jgi:uncharacterized protein with HEPN domain
MLSTSEQGDIDRLKFVLKKIRDLEEYLKRYGSVRELLNDNLGWDASLMCLEQIGETLSKIKDDQIRNRLPVRDAYGLRIIISHRYGDVIFHEVEDTIKKDIPELKVKIEAIFEEIENREEGKE